MRRTNDSTENLKPYKILGLSVLQLMSIIAILGLAMTVVYNAWFA
jgi:hypothetical protein